MAHTCARQNVFSSSTPPLAPSFPSFSSPPPAPAAPSTSPISPPGAGEALLGHLMSPDDLPPPAVRAAYDHQNMGMTEARQAHINDSVIKMLGGNTKVELPPAPPPAPPVEKNEEKPAEAQQAPAPVVNMPLPPVETDAANIR